MPDELTRVPQQEASKDAVGDHEQPDSLDFAAELNVGDWYDTQETGFGVGPDRKEFRGSRQDRKMSHLTRPENLLTVQSPTGVRYFAIPGRPDLALKSERDTGWSKSIVVPMKEAEDYLTEDPTKKPRGTEEAS